MASSNRPRTGQPSHGDLLITRDRSERQGYTLSTIPGPPQLRYRTYDRALLAASAWVSQHGVAIWLTEDGTTFQPVRPNAASTARVSKAPGKHPPARDA